MVADVRWLLTLSAPRVHALNAPYYRKNELDGDVLARSEVLLAQALEHGHRTRRELAAALDGGGVQAAGLRLAYLLMHAELEAVICSGAPRGKQRTYAAFDERVPPAKALPRDDALAELTARYFTSRGPATVKDFARWCSFTLSDAKAGLEMLQPQLAHELVDGRTYWFAASPADERMASPMVDLVQGYDECIMSYSESKVVLHLPATGDDHAVSFTHAAARRPGDRTLAARAQGEVGHDRDQHVPAARPSRDPRARRRRGTVRHVSGRHRQPRPS